MKKIDFNELSQLALIADTRIRQEEHAYSRIVKNRSNQTSHSTWRNHHFGNKKISRNSNPAKKEPEIHPRNTAQ